jgi:hypothetical protein
MTLDHHALVISKQLTSKCHERLDTYKRDSILFYPVKIELPFIMKMSVVAILFVWDLDSLIGIISNKLSNVAI